MIFTTKQEAETRKQMTMIASVQGRPSSHRRVSVVDMLAKVPVNRGSLLKSVEDLLKTIESSENAVMIPTLLRDKCDFDACELLFVAKILKASILGHTDLVEFYMNHASRGQEIQQPEQLASPKIIRRSPTSPLSSSSRTPSDNGLTFQQQLQQNNIPQQQQQQQQQNGIYKSPGSPNFTSTSSSAVSRDSSNNLVPINKHNTNGSSDLSSSSTSWASALTNGSVSLENDSPVGGQRQAQPPSLLQLTTNNNHINSMAANLASTTMDQLMSQLASMQTSDANSNGLLMASHHQRTYNETDYPAPQTSTRQVMPAELRTSASAGSLTRLNSMNSGASSPRVHTAPTTPHPQNSADTLDPNGGASGNNILSGDPSAPVRLLLQIEQLKSSIKHVTSLLESVVELYKKSIDDIA